jgi:hypothetical protein
MTALRNEDVGGLDVAMDDAFAVSGVEGVCDLNGQHQQSLGFQRTPGNLMLQRQPFQILHRHEALVTLLGNLVNGANVGMVQGRSGLRLTLEASEGLRILGDLIGQELQGDKAVQFYILSLVNHTHPATAQPLDDAVVRDCLADHRATPCYAGYRGKSM